MAVCSSRSFTAGNVSCAVSVKVARMRTWLLTWDEPKDKIYNGGVVELALPSLHGGPKWG
jgi:hypothetical protein